MRPGRVTISLLLWLVLSWPAVGRGQRFHVWGQIDLDLQAWKNPTFEQWVISEGLQLGSEGYIWDPALVGYRVRGGLTDFRRQIAGAWSNAVGWQAGLALDWLPKSFMPTSIWVDHITAGLSPGGHPALNLSDDTRFGGSVQLKVAGWPFVQVSALHAITDLNLGPGRLDAPLSAETRPYRTRATEFTVDLRRTAGPHHYDLGVEYKRRTEEQTDAGQRQLRFRAADRTNLTSRLSLEATAEGTLNTIGDQDLSESREITVYGAALDLRYNGPNKTLLTVTNRFTQADFTSATQLGDELVAQLHYSPLRWLRLLGGLAARYLDEDGELSRQREAQEQVALGARVARMLWAGEFNGQAIVRFGDTQVVDEGRGLLFAVNASGHWSLGLATGYQLSLIGSSQTIRDRSPLGANADYYVGRLQNEWNLGWTLRTRADLEVVHSRAEEPRQGDFTVAATQVGGRLAARYLVLSNLRIGARGGYGRYIAHEAGARENAFVEGDLRLELFGGLQLSGEALYFARFEQAGRVSGSLRITGDLSWRVRRLIFMASYEYLDDDFRALGADHRVFAHVVRRFDTYLGGR